MSIHASIAESMSPALESVFGYENPARRVLSKFGTDAHVWIPGIGYFNGLQASNFIDSAGTQAGLVDNPVGRANDAVGAITATQGTTANKPILRRGAVNLLLQSTLPGGGSLPTGWTSTFSTGTSAPVASTIGPEATAYLFSCTAQRAVIHQAVTLASNATYCYSVNIESVTGTISLQDVFVVTNLPAGASLSGWTLNGAAANSNTQAQVGTATVTLSGTYTSGVAYFRIGAGTNSGNVTATVQLSRPQLEVGATASPYVATTTAAASSSSGNYYWQFDGSNDSLALSGPVFQMVDDLAIVAACNPTTDATVARRVFSHAGTSATIDLLIANSTGLVQVRWEDDPGSAIFQSGPAGSCFGQNVVVSALKVGNDKWVRRNGVSGTVNSTVMGAATLDAFYIGAGRGPLAQFNGSIYPVIAIKGTVSDADLLILERWVGQMSGVSI